LCVLLVGDDAVRSNLLARCCEEAGGQETPESLVKACSTFRPRSAMLISSLLRSMSEDAQRVRRWESDATAYTTQLTNAFDTIELLYDLGRSMKAPFSPMEFLRAMCARTRATLRFGWFAVCFDTNAKTPPSLQGCVVHDGSMPLDPDRLLHALQPALRDRDTTCKIRTDIASLCVGGGQIITQPMLCKGHQIGVLVAGAKHGEDPLVSSYDTQLAEACCGFLATFIENVHLYDEQRGLFLGTLQALTAAIDAKDRYTCGHSERVSLISQQLALAAGLPPLACEDLRVAGLVHDVGKIGVPESVLLKAGKLSDDEYDLVKRHPETGHKILATVPLLANVLPGVLHHHERYDGNGYPHGLAGGDIPLMARIIAVADTFDAMSSDRSYRATMSRQVVLAEIRRCAGSQLDPRLCELLQKVDFAEYDAMARRHAQDAAEHVSVVARKAA
jgi:HD-GYP domain-containing protein (c-di-GMP phosphodiesterase class II)